MRVPSKLVCKNKNYRSFLEIWYHFTALSKIYITVCFNVDPVRAKIDRPDEKRTIPIGDGLPVTGTVGDNITSLPNNTITIKCPAAGVPRPSFRWTKNGNDVILGDRISVSSEGTLIIRSTVMGDNGRYKCIVANKAGEDSDSSQLKIAGKIIKNY